MPWVEIPVLLRELLAGSPLEPATLRFLDATSQILGDNKLPFFPAYTDHGGDHVARTIAAAVRLIPDDVWSRELLEPADAAVLLCATALHDLGMHVREAGFSELVAPGSRFLPRPWFDAPQRARSADAPWPELWQAFRKEARHFTVSQLDRLLGPGHAGVPAVAYGDADLNPQEWTEPDRLLMGEFLRRHHARLAHEIAVYGFPGVSPGAFPVLASELPELGEAIGVVARSHHEPLRVMVDYLTYKFGGDLQPAGAWLPYHMGLLRIGDHLQLDAGRAPALLLHLRQPQSPQSLEEWRKHRTIVRVSWGHKDPLAVSITVGSSHSLATHLQLADLFNVLQRELDVTTAVLSELYPTPSLAPLRLARQRVRTNLHTPSLHEQLPYVPRRAALRSAEDLFRLVVGDLYGDRPVVAGRELLQNAVDAVRERRRWEEQHGTAIEDGAFRALPAEVLVELRDEGDRLLLRVVDRGIGMTPDTVVDHFLTAGASLGPSADEHEDLDPATAARWMKAGRFGIGAFAAFLLGTELQVTTRHVGADRGVTFSARLDAELVELRRVTAPFGTEVVVPFPRERLPRTQDGSSGGRGRLLRQVRTFYRLASPDVCFRVVVGDHVRSWGTIGDAPVPSEPMSRDWRSVASAGFDSVLWRTPARGGAESGSFLTHNGMLVAAIDGSRVRPAGYAWSAPAPATLVQRPPLAVVDRRHLLGITLNRYRLTERSLPFERELLRSIGEDVVAHALAGAPRRHPAGRGHGFVPVLGCARWVPLYPGLLAPHLGPQLCVLWVRGGHRDPVAEDFASDVEGSDLPHRVALDAVLENYGRVHPEATTSSSPRQVAIAADRLAALLNMEVRAHVFLSPKLRAVFEQEDLMERLPKGWTFEVTRIANELFVRFVADVACDSDDTVELLTAAGEALIAGSRLGAVGLTALRAIEPTPVDEGDPIVEAWQRLVGAAIERDPDARAAQMAEVLRRDNRMEALFDRWRDG